MLKGILWSAICRNNIVLVEAGEDNRDGGVVRVAQRLLNKKATHGWECKYDCCALRDCAIDKVMENVCFIQMIHTYFNACFIFKYFKSKSLADLVYVG